MAISSAAPIGTLMVKIHRQLASVVSTPPRMTPSADPRPASPDQTPSALARSLPVNIVMTVARAAGESSAAPAPCSARPASSAAGPAARPESSDAPMNTTRPIMVSRLAPKRSAVRPPISMSPPKSTV